MQFLSAYADLGPETELLTVGETGRRVDHYRGGVDLSGEALGGQQVTGDDRLGVARAITLDVGDGRVQVVHHPDAEDEVQVLLSPVLLGGRRRSSGTSRPGRLVADQADAG